RGYWFAAVGRAVAGTRARTRLRGTDRGADLGVAGDHDPANRGRLPKPVRADFLAEAGLCRHGPNQAAFAGYAARHHRSGEALASSVIMTVAVKPLSPERVEDFLAFFDHERGQAFADNPDWAKCYCHYYHVPKVLEWKSFSAEQNRVAMRSRI